MYNYYYNNYKQLDVYLEVVLACPPPPQLDVYLVVWYVCPPPPVRT